MVVTVTQPSALKSYAGHTPCKPFLKGDIKKATIEYSNVGKTRINHPFGNGFTHITTFNPG